MTSNFMIYIKKNPYLQNRKQQSKVGVENVKAKNMSIPSLMSLAPKFFKESASNIINKNSKADAVTPSLATLAQVKSDAPVSATRADYKTIKVEVAKAEKGEKVDAGRETKLVCDKCDGNHETLECPYYKKSRDSHPDAQKNSYKKLGGTSKLPGAILRNARVVRQPGDGSCLFHSMSYGLADGCSANSLRRDICMFIDTHPKTNIADTPIRDWIKWDSNSSISEYTRRMSRGAWGGGIEMACASLLRGVNIHVYERSASGYVRISAFDHPDEPETRKTVRVLYCGGVHYDALVA